MKPCVVCKILFNGYTSAKYCINCRNYKKHYKDRQSQYRENTKQKRLEEAIEVLKSKIN